MNTYPKMLDKIRSTTGVKGAVKLSSKAAAKQAQEQTLDFEADLQQQLI